MQLATFILYFTFLFIVGLVSYHKQKNDTDFIMGGRKLNFWLTALSAHASDMSSWLFLGYPAVIFVNGIFYAWAGIGLTFFMWLNWKYVAPKIRIATEKTKSLTLNTYFNQRFKDRSGTLGLIASIFTLIFFTIYISAGMVGMGLLIEALFDYPYWVGILVGTVIVMLYVFMGGYTSVAWVDLIQGFFLLGVILYIPFSLFIQTNGFSPIFQSAQQQNLTTSLFPNLSAATWIQILSLAAGWGLGYFGQPHIITKFMGIRDVNDMYKAKIVGVSWQALALLGATCLGLFGIFYFPEGLHDPSFVVLNLVKTALSSFVSGLVLCAILAATTNVLAAQILVVASSLAEDFYKRWIKKSAASKELLWVSRISVILTVLFSFIIAYYQVGTVYKLVEYAWSGLGASFGPLLILSLYFKKITRLGAIIGLILGGFFSAIWPMIEPTNTIHLLPLIPGFILSTLAILVVSYFSKDKIDHRRST